MPPRERRRTGISSLPRRPPRTASRRTLRLAPVRVEYKTGDTILDAVARLEDVTISERFGADVETGRITLNDKEYVAACDTHVGVMTLTDMYRPEEVHVVRLHQSVQSENGKDYFPRRCRTSCAQWPRREDKGSRHISPRSRATARPWKARRWPRS